MEDGSGEDTTTTIGPLAAPIPVPNSGMTMKNISFSQPLNHDAIINSAARRSARRKHSLDDDRLFSAALDPTNTFYETSNPDSAVGASSSFGTLSLYGQHYSSPPQASYHHDRSVSVEDSRSRLPPTGSVSNYHYHHGGVNSNSAPFSLGQRSGSGGSSLSAGSEGTSTLERTMSEYGLAPGALPEYVGSGGGSGIFRVPLRGIMHPSRPPALELRPHPMRETQVRSFLRCIVCARSQLWAGSESALRVWNLEDVFEEWPPGLTAKKGDDESAPFRESRPTSPTLCLVVDAANELLWSGHKDGKIRSWKMEQPTVVSPRLEDEGNANAGVQFQECLSWQAHHRTPVLSMVITSYGEIWSGSEGGVIKAWPWEAIEKSLRLNPEERHMSTLLVERSYVDLRNHVSVNGMCSLPPSDVKHMACDNSRSRVWSASSQSFALWDSRTRELLKVFGIDGQVEIRIPDAHSTQESQVEDEIKVKLVSSSKKDKSSMNFLQRSRNALMGAADAVRRVAVKGSFAEDNRKTEAIAISMDGMIWTGYSNGSLVQWDGNGNRIQEFHLYSASIKSICTFGTRLWVGYVTGLVQVLDLDGNLLGGWTAHSGAVIKLAVGCSYVFTLAHHGGIRGWNLNSPAPFDDILRKELANKELSYAKLESFKVLVGTWNVGQERASKDSLVQWLGSAASETGLIVVGLQEVEMGAGFLAMAAAKETVGLEGSANGQWWLDNIGKALDEGTTFHRVGSRQLAGLLIAAWARKNLRPHIGDVEAAAVPCGFGRAIGNKGAVGLRMRVHDRVMSFVNCHFAAHLEAVNRRNADFDHIFRTMAFSKPTVGPNGATANATSVRVPRGANSTGSQHDDVKPELSEADMLVFLGDFNYRLHSITYDEARDMVSQRCFDWLRERDQLRAEMKAGKVFQGMREAPISFPPTYKFERHQPGLSGYDSGEKKRIPAWCDRILYRDCRPFAVAECSLECPVVASINLYEACMEVSDSDHKPVRCKFSVEVTHVDELVRRQEYGEIIASNEKISSLLEECCTVPETIVNTNNIILQNQETSALRVTNKSEKHQATFQIICEGQATIKEDGNPNEYCRRGSFGFPLWLQVQPAVGLIKPGKTVEISVHHDEFCTQEEFVDGIPQNWWCEDTRDKEVILLVNITGTGSSESTCHRILVRHCFSSASVSSSDAKRPSKRNQANSSHKPDASRSGNSSGSHKSDASRSGNSSGIPNDMCHIRCL